MYKKNLISFLFLMLLTSLSSFEMYIEKGGVKQFNYSALLTEEVKEEDHIRKKYTIRVYLDLNSITENTVGKLTIQRYDLEKYDIVKNVNVQILPDSTIKCYDSINDSLILDGRFVNKKNIDADYYNFDKNVFSMKLLRLYITGENSINNNLPELNSPILVIDDNNKVSRIDLSKYLDTNYNYSFYCFFHRYLNDINCYLLYMQGRGNRYFMYIGQDSSLIFNNIQVFTFHSFKDKIFNEHIKSFSKVSNDFAYYIYDLKKHKKYLLEFDSSENLLNGIQYNEISDIDSIQTTKFRELDLSFMDYKSKMILQYDLWHFSQNQPSYSFRRANLINPAPEIDFSEVLNIVKEANANNASGITGHFCSCDYNFDGYYDLSIANGGNGKGASYYYIWLYNPEKKSLEYNEFLSSKSFVKIDHQNKIIETFIRWGRLDNILENYIIENNKFKLIYYKKSDYNSSDKIQKVIERELLNGEWVETIEEIQH